MDVSFGTRNWVDTVFLDYRIKYVAAIFNAKFNIFLFVSLVHYQPLTHFYFTTYQYVLSQVVFLIFKVLYPILIESSRWPMEEDVTALIQLS